MTDAASTQNPKPSSSLIPRRSTERRESSEDVAKPEAPEETPKLHQARRSSFGALISRTLPNYSGNFAVGVCDVELPVEKRTFGTFRHRSMPSSNAGLAMETVMFTLFYPCEAPKDPKPVVWFPKIQQTIDGFLKMAHRTPNFWYRMVAYPLAAAAIYGATFPACKDAPLLPPPAAFGKWPLMLFSHGVGCSRLMYSAFCGEMASRGYIVACIEHRDGTAPSSTVRAADGTKKTFDWLQWSDLDWPDLSKEDQPRDDTVLRHEQIRFRVAEIEEVVAAMRKLANGEDVMGNSLVAPKLDWKMWRNLDPRRPVMSGHSLGGSAALAVSSANTIPFSAVVAFDPATQRLAPWHFPLPHPLLVVNSEEFTTGKEYEIFWGQVASTTEDSLQVLSIGGATHPSFSDVFLILPDRLNRMTGLTVRADIVIKRAVHAVEEFLVLKPGHKARIDSSNTPFVAGDVKECHEEPPAELKADGPPKITPRSKLGALNATERGKSWVGESGVWVEHKQGCGRVSYDRALDTRKDSVALEKGRDKGSSKPKKEKTDEKIKKPVGTPGELVFHPLPAQVRS